jgi:DNA-binding CsgD family transcriptional regulator
MPVAGGERQRPQIGWASPTPVERDVVLLVAAGHTHAETGQRLFISVNTVKKYLSRVYAKVPGLVTFSDLFSVIVGRMTAPDAGRRHMSNQRTRYVTTTDGVTIGATVHGQGPPLVFLLRCHWRWRPRLAGAAAAPDRPVRLAVCAEACRRCERACRELIAAIAA